MDNRLMRGWCILLPMSLQLLSAGLLSVDMGEISGFRLRGESRAVLRGERDVFFRKDSAPSKKRIRKRAPKTPERAFLEEEPQALFEKLRKLRLDISKYLGFPPYIVFQDKALKEMTLLKPSNVKEFLRIKGAGETKAQKYAEIFMACIRGEDPDIAAHIEKKGDAGDADAKDTDLTDNFQCEKAADYRTPQRRQSEFC